MKIITKIKNRINKKEREEIEFWKKEAERHESDKKKYMVHLLKNRCHIRDSINELKAEGILSEEDVTKFNHLLDVKYGYRIL